MRESLRFGIFATAWCAAFFGAPAGARAASFPAVNITAQQIALYADRGLLVAGGGVAVHLRAEQLSATRALYDLCANRLILAGDVSLTDVRGTRTGSSYVYDFAAKRGAFAAATVPQLSTNEATAIAQQVTLRPAQSITFTAGQALSGGTLVPVATYTYAIPPPGAKDFGYSPVPSAALEWPVLLASGRDAYSFARLRFDRYNGGPGAGFEEHYARTDRGYAALGETLDADGARFDLAAFERIDGRFTQSLNGSSLYGSRALRYSLMSSGKRGYASLSFAQYNGSRSDDLYLTGNQRQLGHAGSFRLQVDAGHDVHPGDYRAAQDYRLTPGVHVDTASVHIGIASLSASADLGESVYDYGRGTLATDASLWGTFPVNARLSFNGGATFSHQAPPFPSTYRTYSAGMTWKASRAFNLISSLTYAHDFAQAFGVGRPQLSAAFDVSVRRKNGTGIEIGAIVPFGTVGNFSRAGVLNVRFLR